MLFKKLKTYNTPEKLLKKLKEMRQEELQKQQQAEALKTKQQFQRKTSLKSSGRTTWTSLKNIHSSPQVKAGLDIQKMNMPKLVTEISSQRKSSQLRAKINIRRTDAFQVLREIEKNEDSEKKQEELIIDQVASERLEIMDDLIKQDWKQIEQMNEEAKIESSKTEPSGHSPARSPSKSPARSPGKKFFHHHHHHPSNNTKRASKFLVPPSVDEFDQIQEIKKIGSIESKLNKVVLTDSDRNKYLSKYRFANKNLARVSQQDYRMTVKSFEKLDDYADFYKQQQNVYMSLNRTAKSQNIFQSGLGLVTDTNQIINANASSMIRTHQKVRVFAEALQTIQCKTMKTLKLSENCLTSQKIALVIKNLPQQLQELDLMSNSLNSKSCQIIAKYIKNSQIKKLNLENNKIGDLGANSISEALLDNDYLLYLNLSSNHLTEFCTNELSNYLRKTQSLYELYLHFNSINPTGATNLWKALYKNSSVKVFDISYNRTASLECAQTMAKVIAKPYPELMHIDVSHNGFDEPQSIEIKKALEANQNIYGFHFEGNCQKYTVDCLGHLIDLEAEEIDRQNKVNEGRANPITNLKLLDEDKVQTQPQPKVKSERLNSYHHLKRIEGFNPILRGKQESQNICWICQGWQQVKFTWTPGKSGGMDNDPIFIHLSSEGYKPILMQKLQGEFYLYRMCPPNSVIYYFFTNPVLGIQTVAKNQLTIKTPNSDPISFEQQEFLYNGNILIDGNKMSFVNEIYTENDQLVIEKYIPKVYCKPREEDKVYDLTKFMSKKQNFWSYEISIFKNYQPDNEDLVNECFEQDFGSSKIPRLIKDAEVDEIKEILRDIYPYIFNTYKLYASVLIGSALPCISNNAFIDFLSQTHVLDQKYKPSDVDLNFISTSNAKDVVYPNTYEKALVRYQFMEVIVRLALDKYYRTGICKSQKASIMKLFDEDLIKQRLLEVDRSQDWRDSRYWNEQCDMILKDRLPMLKLLFKFTCKLNSKQKYYKHPWIQFKDFRDLLNKCDLYCDTFVERDAYLAYLLSMQTQIDELYQMRHFQMEFYEFLEALARCAEKLSLVRHEDHLTIEERRTEPLWKKLDALTLFIYVRAGDTIKQTLKEQDDFTEFDKCMSIRQKSLKQQIEDLGEIDEKPYNPAVEEQMLSDQLKQVIIQPTVMLKSTTTKGMSFMQLVKQAQQQQKAKNQFNLTNIVSYFKQKEEEMQREEQKSFQN